MGTTVSSRAMRTNDVFRRGPRIGWQRHSDREGHRRAKRGKQNALTSLWRFRLCLLKHAGSCVAIWRGVAEQSKSKREQGSCCVLLCTWSCCGNIWYATDTSTAAWSNRRQYVRTRKLDCEAVYAHMSSHGRTGRAEALRILIAQSRGSSAVLRSKTYIVTFLHRKK